MNDELGLYIASKVSDPSEDFDIDGLYATSNSLEVNGIEKSGNIKDIISSISSEWINKLEVRKGKLVYVGENIQEIEWAYEVLRNAKEKTVETQPNTSSIALNSCLSSNVVGLKIYGNSDNVGVKTNNLIDINANDLTNGYLTYIGKIIGSTACKISNYINISEYEYITISYSNKGEALNNPSICFYDENYTFISGEKYDNRTRITFLVPENSVYMRCSFRITDAEFMVEVGNTATEYEPYGYKIPININGTIYKIFIDEPLRQANGYSDYIDTATKMVYRHVYQNDDGDWVGSSDLIGTESIDVPDMLLNEGDKYYFNWYRHCTK